MHSFFVISGLAASALAQTYSATYTPGNAPNQTEQGQEGTNQCGTSNSQTSMCQNAYSAWLRSYRVDRSLMLSQSTLSMTSASLPLLSLEQALLSERPR